MERALNNTQLKAKMYDILISLHTNHPKILWHVHDNRGEDSKSNLVIIRGSFQMPPEGGREWGEELAAITMIDATEEHLQDIICDLGEGYEADMHRKLTEKNNG